jgi:alanyl-tRNA synthetase
VISKKELQELKKKEKLLKKAAEILRVGEKDLPRVVERFKKEIDEMDRKLNG